MAAADTLRDTIRRWPKVDLHRHLEGAVRPQTILELYRRNEGRHSQASLEELLPLVQVTGAEQSLFDFLDKFSDIMPALRTSADLRRITCEAAEDAWADGIVYLELRCCPHFIAEYNGMNPREAAVAVVEGREMAMARFPAHVELILIVPQYGGEQVAAETLDLALEYRSRGVRGLDVAGDIRQLGLEVYKPVFQQAATAGLGITLHAGEVTPADTVRLAVEEMYAARIGHGIRAIDDPGVVRLLKERNTLLEVCVTSNLQTRAARSLQEHPIRSLMEAGVRVSVNTDDPAISRLALTDEYALLIDSLRFSPQDFQTLNLNAIDSAFTTVEVKADIRQKLTNWNWELPEE